MGGPENGFGHNSIDEEAGRNSSREQLVVKASSWKGYIWDTWELPKEERWLLFKVDAFVLTFASVCDNFQSRCSEQKKENADRSGCLAWLLSQES